MSILADKKTGLLMGEGWEVIREFCTVCHSSQRVIESRLSRKRWEELILSKQNTPGFKDMGDREETVIDYLASYYAEPGTRTKIYPKDEKSGLIKGHGWKVVRVICSTCHSTKLVIQNRGNRETWLERIRWMQKTQGLWKLGKLEPVILDYLAEFYGVTKRRYIPGLPASLQPR